MSATREHSYLRRLNPGAYRSQAVVHWIHSIEDRRKGWLSEPFHLWFRELLLHAGSVRGIVCPAYCLMPDHIHLLWMGICEDTDQRTATQWLRREITDKLVDLGFRLQKQAYDRVLRERERQRNSFEDLVSYVLANPERAGLGRSSAYAGMVFPGYPKMCRSLLDYPDDWDMFWKLYFRAIEKER